MSQRLAQQVAIITGASRGIGLAIAQAYAAEGATLCLIATDTTRLDEVKNSLGLPDDRVMCLGADRRSLAVGRSQPRAAACTPVRDR